MAPSRATYDVLPSSDPESFSAASDEFKDKPLQRHSFLLSLLRNARRFVSRRCRPLYVFLFFLFALFCQLAFNASYSASSAPSFQQDTKEMVYIAANIVDGDLVRGAWGQSLVDLVELIGRDRVFVSVYGGPTDALKELEGRLHCEKSIVSEEQDPLDMGQFPRLALPTGGTRLKRIAFLAEVRNKALAPLDKLERRFDKVLFINDVFFSAKDAVRLLWGTNVNSETGKAEYKAVCGVDFVTTWKLYDTFATRDTEGYGLGVPLYPWFSKEGKMLSRKDVLAGKDNVRVKSCWGGIVAFDGRYLQASQDAPEQKTANKAVDATTGSAQLPLKFRYEPEMFWEASECCLIHADIMSIPPFSAPLPSNPKHPSNSPTNPDPFDTGIYMNPYVRVSYDATTHKWIWLVQRFERLFTLPQAFINYLANMPHFNFRRLEVEGQIIEDKKWVSNHEDHSGPNVIPPPLQMRDPADGMKSNEWWAQQGRYVDVNRTAARGGYCGVRELLVLRENKKKGERNWENLASAVPPLNI